MTDASLPRRASLARSGTFLLATLLGGGVVLQIILVASAAATRPCRGLPATPCPSLLADWIPLLVALAFWLTSLAIWYLQHESRDAFFFMLVAGTLAAGKLTTILLESPVVIFLFYVHLTYLPVAMVHFHYRFIQDQAPRLAAVQKRILYGFGVVALLLTLLLVSAMLQASSSPLFRFSLLSIRLGIVSGFMATALLLAVDYRQPLSAVTKRRIRLISCGTIIGFAPLLLLSLLPNTLFLPYYLPYTITFPLLVFSPLLYLYAFSIQRFVWVEGIAQRMLRTFLLFLVLLALFWASMTLIQLRLLRPNEEEVFLFTIICLAGILVVVLYPHVQRFVFWILHGRGIQYEQLADDFIATFSIVPNRRTIEHYLQRRLPTDLRIRDTLLYIQERTTNTFYPTGLKHNETTAFTPLPLSSPLVHYLQAHPSVLDARTVEAALSGVVTTAASENRLVARPGNRLWLPFVSQGVLRGFFVVGERQNEDPYTEQDIAFFRVIMQQMGIALHNLSLLEEVEARGEELDMAHRDLLVHLERERLEIARNLHDGPLQHLLSIAYRFGGEATQQADSTIAALFQNSRYRVLEVTAQLRAVLRELRPAGLYELGLAAALQGFVGSLAREDWQVLPAIRLDVQCPLPALPDAVAVCLFRVIQEALRNVLKHANATEVLVRVRQTQDGISAIVRDDGVGFEMVERVSEFARADHFGVLGMAERVAWAHGTFTLESSPNEGTVVSVWVPLAAERSSE